MGHDAAWLRWLRLLWLAVPRFSGVRLTANGIVALALALFVKRALDQAMLYNVLAAIGGALVIYGAVRILEEE